MRNSTLFKNCSKYKGGHREQNYVKVIFHARAGDVSKVKRPLTRSNLLNNI